MSIPDKFEKRWSEITKDIVSLMPEFAVIKMREAAWQICLEREKELVEQYRNNYFNAWGGGGIV